GRFELLGQHLGGAFNNTEGITDFMREPGGKLSERGQPLGTTGMRLRARKAAIGLGELLGDGLIAKRLPAVLHGEPVHDDRSDKEKQDSDSEFGNPAWR